MHEARVYAGTVEWNAVFESGEARPERGRADVMRLARFVALAVNSRSPEQSGPKQTPWMFKSRVTISSQETASRSLIGWWIGSQRTLPQGRHWTRQARRRNRR